MLAHQKSHQSVSAVTNANLEKGPQKLKAQAIDPNQPVTYSQHLFHLNEMYEHFNEKIDQLQTDLSSFSDRSTANTEEISELSTKVSKLTALHKTLSDRTEESINDLRSNSALEFKQLRDREDTRNTKLNNLSDRVFEIDGAASSIAFDMTKLKNSIITPSKHTGTQTTPSVRSISTQTTFKKPSSAGEKGKSVQFNLES